MSYFCHNNTRIIISYNNINIIYINSTSELNINKFNTATCFVKYPFLMDDKHIYNFETNKIYNVKLPEIYTVHKYIDINYNLLYLFVKDNNNKIKFITVNCSDLDFHLIENNNKSKIH